MYSIQKLALLITLIMLPLAASAVVLEQAPLDGGDGSLSVGPSGAQIATDDFQFASDVQLTNIRWWGSYDPAAPVTESFTVRLFADDGSGSPETNAFFETTFAGNGDSSGGLTDLFGGTVFQYDLGVNQMLQGGADYYLSVFNNDGNQDWFWLASAAGNNTGWSRAADVDTWNFDAQTFNMSFQLTADTVTTGVPEPFTLSLMLLPMLWLVGLARRNIG